jgi:hypothetical protein
MSVLRANLRLFWECSSLWVPYAYIFSVVVFILMWDLMGIHLESDLFPVLAAVVVPISQIVAVMQVEILSCPFALTLPGHQSIVRQVVFIVGLVVSLGVTLIVLPDIALADHLILRLWATFVASLAVYFVGTGLTYVFTLPGLTIAVLAWIVAFLGFNWGINAAAAHIILDSPIPVTIAGSLSAGIVWLCLGRPPWRLQVGGSSRKWLSKRWNRHRVGETRYANSASNGFTLDLMRAGKRPSAAKYIWGTLYASWVPGGGGRRQLLTTFSLALVCAALAWYFPRMGPMFIMMGPFEGIAQRSLYSELLFTRGRRERFLATLMVLIVVGCVWTISIVLSFVALDLVQPYLPQAGARVADLEQGIPPANIRLAVLLTAAYPILALIHLALHGRPPQGYAACMYTALSLLVCLTVTYARCWLTSIPLVCVAFVLVASWGICAYGLYRVTMRRDLVSGRPEKPDWSWLEIRHRITDLREQGRK